MAEEVGKRWLREWGRDGRGSEERWQREWREMAEGVGKRCRGRGKQMVEGVGKRWERRRKRKNRRLRSVNSSPDISKVILASRSRLGISVRLFPAKYK